MALNTRKLKIKKIPYIFRILDQDIPRQHNTRTSQPALDRATCPITTYSILQCCFQGQQLLSLHYFVGLQVRLNKNQMLTSTVWHLKIEKKNIFYHVVTYCSNSTVVVNVYVSHSQTHFLQAR